MDNKDKELLKSFPKYDEKNPSSWEGSRDYWESVFEHETNRDTELHKAFGELHTKIVNEVIQFCKEHNLDVDEFCVSADGSLDKQDLLTIIKYGLRSAEVPDGVCVPADVTVEDIYELIGCFYIHDVM